MRTIKLTGSTGRDPSHIDAYVQRIVDEAPPLSAEQKSRLALLLRPSVRS